MKRVATFILSLIMIFSVCSAGITAQAASLSKPSNVKAYSITSTAVKVTWKKSAAASGYYVYRSVNKSKNFKQIARLKKNHGAYISYGLKTGKKYYFKVTAYRGKSKKTSSTVSAKPMPYKVTGLTAIRRYNGADLVWDYQNGISGYEIYMSSSKYGEYTRIGKTSSYKFKHNNAKKGQSYYYKVRAYKKSNGKTFYSPFTDPYWFNSDYRLLYSYNKSGYDLYAYNTDIFYYWDDYEMEDYYIIDGRVYPRVKALASVVNTYKIGETHSISYYSKKDVIRTDTFKITEKYGKNIIGKMIKRVDKNTSKNKKTNKKYYESEIVFVKSGKYYEYFDVLDDYPIHDRRDSFSVTLYVPFSASSGYAGEMISSLKEWGYDSKIMFHDIVVKDDITKTIYLPA